jgi:hypothetical protein
MRNMKKIITFLKVVTFLNIELISITLLLILLSFFGYNYINCSISDNMELKNKIIKNEKELLNTYKITNNMSRIDEEILSKCLDVNKPYDSLSIDIKDLIYQKNRLKVDKKTSIILDSLIVEKLLMYYEIDEFVGKKVNFSKVTYPNKIYTVSKNVTKRLFTDKTEYVTNVKEYDKINVSLLKKEYTKISIVNSNTKNNLIKRNNDLSLNIRSILDQYSNSKFNGNVIKYKKISDKLESNLGKYIKVVILITMLYSFLIYLLISDIRKKNKSITRGKYTISMLIDRYNDK